MNWKTRTRSCRSPAQTRLPPLPGYRAPGAAAGSRAAVGSALPSQRTADHRHGGPRRAPLAGPSSRSPAAMAQTRAPALLESCPLEPIRPSAVETPADTPGETSPSEHLLLNCRGVHQTGSSPINLGDIVVDGENLLGDGVNVAARLEALAAPGGICVSEAVHVAKPHPVSLRQIAIPFIDRELSRCKR